MSILDAILTGPFLYAENTKCMAAQHAELTPDEQQRLLCFAIESAERSSPCDACLDLREAYDKVEEANDLLRSLCEALYIDEDAEEEGVGTLLLYAVREVLLQHNDVSLRDKLLAMSGLTSGPTLE